MTTIGRWSPNDVRERVLGDSWVFADDFIKGDGIALVAPTSYSTIGTNSSAKIVGSGSISFSDIQNLSLNGVFTSTYINYMIVIRFTNLTNPMNVYMRLRSSGIDNSATSSYVYQSLISYSTSPSYSTSLSGARTVADSWNVFNSAAIFRAGSTMYIYNPQITQPSAFRAVSVVDTNYAQINDYAGTHNQSLSYDGFTLIVGNNINGLISVYGLEN